MATATSVPDSKGDLARLLATEQRLEQLVTDARARAETIIATARALAAKRESDMAAELAAATRQLESTLAAERAARQAELERQLAEDRLRFENVSATTIDAMAAYVVSRVVGSPPT